MSYDEDESRDIKAEHPLTPRPDNSWVEALPEYRWKEKTMSTPKPPQERICIGGVDGSPSCGHGELVLVNGECRAAIDSRLFKRTICGHRCQFQLESAARADELRRVQEQIAHGVEAQDILEYCVCGHTITQHRSRFNRRLLPSRCLIEPCKCVKFRRGEKPATASPAQPEVSEFGAYWQKWFEVVGAHATIDVVNATTKLVLAEREIHERDHSAPAQPAPPEQRITAETLLEQLQLLGYVKSELTGTAKHGVLGVLRTAIVNANADGRAGVRSDSEAPLTVEQALAELREMFPVESFLYVRQEARHSRSAGRDVVAGSPAPYIEVIREAKIQIGGTSYAGDTLAEAMGAVRAAAKGKQDG